MRFVIVTGVSGAGKSSMINSLFDNFKLETSHLCRQSADPFTGEICITDA